MSDKKAISPEKVQKILKEDDTIVSIEQAKAILKFLNCLAEISLAAYIEGQRSNP